jgi:phosphoribosylamine---glycine ligase
VGSGGREHALAWKLAQEADVCCAPGNAGIADDVQCYDVQPSQHNEIIALCKSEGIDLVVVGPEDPLIAGLANALRDNNIATFGPNQDAAQLEGSKAFSKMMMARAGVPTAEYQAFEDTDDAKAYCQEMFAKGKQVAVKASGNALGKGVIVCETLDEATQAVDELHALGEAGRTLIVEERMTGREFSLLTLVSDGHIHSLPVAQDYKRVNDQDQGPNTGGMGTYSPLPWLNDSLISQVETEIVQPVIASLAEMGIGYRGVLFSGIMVTPDGPKCLEYNVRFGDPETQSVMMRLGRGFAEALYACAKGEPIPAIAVKAVYVNTVVAASGGYPGSYRRGLPIAFGIYPFPDGVKIFHAGTTWIQGHLSTNGGRVLAVSATSATPSDARKLAYEAMNQICFEGMHYRRDIGA